MRYRRLLDQLNQQNWTAIGIDLVIVVVGVFIGIQVANWNGTLADQRKGRAYEARLAADLGRDLASRRALVAYYGAVLDSVVRADALLAQPDTDPKALIVAVYRASEVNYRPASRATWDEIVSSGDTGLLPRDLAQGAAEYFAFDSARNALDVLGGSAYRQIVRSIIPLAVQIALRAGCSDERNESQDIIGFMPDCRLDIAPETMLATAAALRADPAVHAALRNQYSDVFSTLANITGEAISIEGALAALNGPPLPPEAAP